MPAPFAGVDSGMTLFRALARYLYGEDFPALGIAPQSVAAVLPYGNYLPSVARRKLYRWGTAEAIDPDRLGEVDVDALRAWAADRWARRDSGNRDIVGRRDGPRRTRRVGPADTLGRGRCGEPRVEVGVKRPVLGHPFEWPFADRTEGIREPHCGQPAGGKTEIPGQSPWKWAPDWNRGADRSPRISSAAASSDPRSMYPRVRVAVSCSVIAEPPEQLHGVVEYPLGPPGSSLSARA